MINGTAYTDNPAAFSRWLDRLSRPETEDLRSPIWRKSPKPAPENGWSRGEARDSFLSYVRLHGPKFSPHMEEREHKELERFLIPWSERPAWNDWGPQTVAAYYGPWKGTLSTLDRDMSTFKQRWGVRATAYPFRKTAHRLPSSTSSGLPWLTSGWMSNIGDAVLAETEWQWKNDSPRDIPPSMPMWRVDPPGKVRLAWAESKYEALYGAPFVYPIQDKMRRRESSPFDAWNGPAVVQSAITRDLEQNDFDYISCDYSKFDQTQSPELMQRVLHSLVHPMIGNIKPKVFDTWAQNLSTGKLITPNAVHEGEHGMPSGSVATNFVDSIVNALCIEGYLDNYGIRDNKYWVQGDDAVIRGKGVDPKDFAEFASSEYGFNVHPDKQLFGHRECDFLQNSYYVENDFLPTYPAARVGWRMIGHERYSYSGSKWNEWAVVVRAVQQMNNALYNPSVLGLAKWGVKGDQLKLGAELPPKSVFRKAGSVAYDMTLARSSWDPGAIGQRDWDILPIQQKIREASSEM